MSQQRDSVWFRIFFSHATKIIPFLRRPHARPYVTAVFFPLLPRCHREECNYGTVPATILYISKQIYYKTNFYFYLYHRLCNFTKTKKKLKSNDYSRDERNVFLGMLFHSIDYSLRCSKKSHPAHAQKEVIVRVGLGFGRCCP